VLQAAADARLAACSLNLTNMLVAIGWHFMIRRTFGFRIIINDLKAEEAVTIGSHVPDDSCREEADRGRQV
jgi:hypothetical protein